LQEKLDAALARVEEGWTPPKRLPDTAVIHSPERLIIDFGDHEELLDRLHKAQKVMGYDSAQAWQAVEAQGIFRGSGPARGKIAFMFPGQGSQYVNMGRELVDLFPVVREVFDAADAVMTPILGKPLTDYLFVDPGDSTAVNAATFSLMQTEITQPAMLMMDMAMLKLLEMYGFQPDIVVGHSLGEYAALIAAGAMPFADALEATAARGGEMASLSLEDNGKMAAVLAPYDAVEATLQKVDGYVVPANINSASQCVIGGESTAVEQAVQLFEEQEYRAMILPVSHAFHTRIVAPAGEPLRQVLDRLDIRSPQMPLVANVTGDFYPTDVTAIKDMLQKQVSSPVQWVKGLETLYEAGVRAFVEVGPKRALRGFAKDVFKERDDVIALMTNHPKTGALPAFNQALCGLYAAGYGGDRYSVSGDRYSVGEQVEEEREDVMVSQNDGSGAIDLQELSRMVAQQLAESPVTNLQSFDPAQDKSPISNLQFYDRNQPPPGSVVISGTGLGLPGAEKAVFDPDNARLILQGEQFIDLIPERFRQRMVEKHVTRLVKGADGSGRFAFIDDPSDVVRLAGRPGAFDLAEEYGVPEKLVNALDVTTQLALAAGLDALREAGIPLMMKYKQASNGSYLPQRWQLPEALRDETGVIFASAFPGGDHFAAELERFFTYQSRLEQLEMLEDLRRQTRDEAALREIMRRIADLREALEREPYVFDRRFLFRVLAMGHAQFAEYIGARGPNTQVNAACASTTQAIGMAEDWIRHGRCRRVVVIAADDVTSDTLMEWVGAGFLALGAVATDDRVDEAALPFDKRRHGTILGMGACALVIESEDAVRERGMRGIVEILGTEIRNSAYHGSRLDVNHISQVMESVVTSAERRFGLNRYAIAPQLVFMSHETFTPARGGSAAAEVAALRHTFGEAAQEVVVANTKGYTGHPMGVGIEDVIALKILEYGIVPPVPNLQEADPDLGPLNLSRGGRYPVQYALHLSAGFGSQIAFSFTRRIPGGLDRIDNKPLYQRWLDDVSGYDYAELEVVKRNLRVVAKGNPSRRPAPSRWQVGTGPVMRVQFSVFSDQFSVGSGQYSVERLEPAPEPVVVDDKVTRWEGDKARTEPVEVVTAVAEPVISEQSSVVSGQLPVEAEPITENRPPITDNRSPITDKILEIVAEQTGYPTDMLELDLDLEADLGIDTVKQAETFLAIREAFDIPRLENLQLRDYPTLGHVIGFVREMRPDLADGDRSSVIGERSSVIGNRLSVGDEPITENRPPITDNGSPITDKILEIVAEQTGYPTDMLELDLDLEADLGIDTVKQAETFLAIREAFDIPRLENLQLRDYPTLGHVIGFVREMRPDLADGERSSVSGNRLSVGDEPIIDDGSPITDNLADADLMPRRVPVPVLRPSLDVCQPTGVTLDENSRVIVAVDKGGVAKALRKRLEKRGATVLALEPSLGQEQLAEQVQDWLADGRIQGVYWLAALDAEPDIEQMDLAAWREANRTRVKNLAATMRALYDAVSGPGSFLVVGTRLGGLHGYGAAGATAPLGGGAAGFAKAYGRERPDALVKVVDFAVSRKTAAPADILIAETLADPGVVEVGYWGDGRYSVGLMEQPAADGRAGLTLNRDTVFLVTGAAGGITSEIVADLAGASGGVFYLLDLTPEPEAADPAIALFRQDKAALQAQLLAETKAAGEKPVAAQKKLAAVERAAAALRAIEAVQAAGGTAVYHSVNLLDDAALTEIVAEIGERYGRIDVLIHAGGIEISKGLDRKPPEQFELVYDVKADGFYSLLHAAKGLPIGAVVAFSSVAGRFGNRGQTDYSAANDLLCKICSSMRRWRPDTRAIAIDWTAWADIGMAARGSIPQIMEMAGIEMLPAKCGVPTVRRELTAGGFGGEVLVAGKLGLLTAGREENGGLDSERFNSPQRRGERGGILVERVTAAQVYGGWRAETTLDPQEQPFLRDHALDGTPLLPGVMGTEVFAELAQAIAPGYGVTAVTDEQFYAPFKFYRMEPQTLYLSATAVPESDGDLLVYAELRSRREIKSGRQEKRHFSATVHLSKNAPVAPDAAFTPPESLDIPAGAIYDIYFHGPAYRVLAGAAVDGDQAVGLLADALPPNMNPADAPELMAPRLIELCFQTAGVWQLRQQGKMALPLALGSVTAYRQEREADGRLYAVVQAVDGGEAFAAQVVDRNGRVYVTLRGYRTVALPGKVQL
ncbi:MAG: SDR family NAD(P)-dependent oxidoreductase, partial [Chloroflexi bacterium]|nr:SDR family NAD(P)-dependent oxidoreductase [Chloroflexota bacterium]